MSEETRYCVDCKYHIGVPFGSDVCHRPQYLSNNLVTGKPRVIYCENERDSYERCDPGGAYFEPKTGEAV